MCVFALLCLLSVISVGFRSDFSFRCFLLTLTFFLLFLSAPFSLVHRPLFVVKCGITVVVVCRRCIVITMLSFETSVVRRSCFDCFAVLVLFRSSGAPSPLDLSPRSMRSRRPTLASVGGAPSPLELSPSNSQFPSRRVSRAGSSTVAQTTATSVTSPPMKKYELFFMAIFHGLYKKNSAMG